MLDLLLQQLVLTFCRFVCDAEPSLRRLSYLHLLRESVSLRQRLRSMRPHLTLRVLVDLLFHLRVCRCAAPPDLTLRLPMSLRLLMIIKIRVVSKLTLRSFCKLEKTILVNFPGVVWIAAEYLLIIFLVFFQLVKVRMLVQAFYLRAVRVKSVIKQVGLGVQILKTLLDQS